MTLCITAGTPSKIIAIADSQLTTVGPNHEVASCLPSNLKIVHVNTTAIKVQIISHPESLYGDRHDIVFALAGNVALGLQSVMHIDAVLRGMPLCWFDHIKVTIFDRIIEFWTPARDRNIEYTISIADHKGRVHLFEIVGTDNGVEIEEVLNDDGILLSVIGDNKESVRNQILSEVNALSHFFKVDEALHYASIRALKRAVDDESNVFVGGSIQGAELTRHKGQYYIFDSYMKFFKGAALEEWESLTYPIINLNEAIFDHSKKVSELF